jgi:plastocyanin
MRTILFGLGLVCALGGCTAGAPAAGGTSAAAGARTTTIDVSLTTSTVAATPYGDSGGYTPPVTTVALGDSVRFVNVDGFAHTATALSASTSAFPSAAPFASSALSASGDRLSAGWSSGTLAAGAASPPLLADAPGTYLYGCFFHYGAPMRGAIVVR